MTDKISNVFGMIPMQTPDLPAIPNVSKTGKQIADDSDYARRNLKQLIETSRSALQHALDLAVQSESPRAYEVLANLIKTASDLNTSLIDAHQREQKMTLPETPVAPTEGGVTNVTNNVLFTGTTDELQDFIMRKIQNG